MSSCALGSVVTVFKVLLSVLSHFIHTSLCKATKPPFPHLTVEEIEAQEAKMTCQRSQDRKSIPLNLEVSSAFQPHVPTPFPQVAHHLKEADLWDVLSSDF